MLLLGICGSLREASTNRRLLAAAQTLVPPGVEMRVTSCVGRLPLFNPDLRAEDFEVVREWLDEMRAADGIVVSTPEYARGYPGALKNALDWLVSTDAYIDKPFMLLNASARSVVAQETLTIVLETMSGVHIESATTTVPLLGTRAEVPDIVGNPEMAHRIATAVRTFVAELQKLPRWNSARD
jgi:NAD(P)H-dependent FMN reductase